MYRRGFTFWDKVFILFMCGLISQFWDNCSFRERVRLKKEIQSSHGWYDDYDQLSTKQLREIRDEATLAYRASNMRYLLNQEYPEEVLDSVYIQMKLDMGDTTALASKREGNSGLLLFASPREVRRMYEIMILKWK